MCFSAAILWHKKTAFLFPYEGISKRRLYGVLFVSMIVRGGSILGCRSLTAGFANLQKALNVYSICSLYASAEVIDNSSLFSTRQTVISIYNR